MGYTRSQTFVPGAFLRPCDVCGIRYRSTELARGEDGLWRCTTYCQEVPALTRDKISAQSQMRREAPPPPHGIVFDQLDTYESAEARIFNLLCEMPVADSTFPGGVRLGLAPLANVQVNNGAGYQQSTSSQSGVTAGESARYLYNLISENKRPTRWISVATAKLREIADWIITKQNGFGVSPTNTLANSPAYGQVGLSNTPGSTEETASAGLGLLYAYKLLGDQKYLTSAQACAHHLRNVQARGHANAINFVASDVGGTLRLYTGGMEQRTLVSSGNFLGNHRFYPSSLIALEFLNALYTAIGDGSYGATGSISGAFTGSVAANLSQMIADLRAFWSVGAADSVLGSTITGLSATTPRENFNAYNSTNAIFGNGTGAWEFQDAGASTGTLITGSNFSQALRSLYFYEGYSSQVSGVWTWLMAFAANPAFVSAAGSLASDYAVQTTTLAANPPAPPSGQGNTVAPAYDPKLALTTLLLVRDPNNGYAAIAQNGSSVYDWSTAGHMAAIQASRDAGSFRKAKDAVATERYRLRPENITDGSYVITDFVCLRGLSGLAYQLNANDSSTRKLWSVVPAAAIGGMFRCQPQSWTGTNPPASAPGLQV